MLRGALHIAVVFSFLWLPLNRKHNIVLVFPDEDLPSAYAGADAKKLAGAVTAAHVVVQCDFPGQWTGGAAALDTARPFQAIDNALQAAGAPRIQWDVLVR